MNQIDFFEEVCYSKSLKMKAYLKLGISCACSVLGIGLFIAGITFGIIHFNNSQGQGGLSDPASITPNELTDDIALQMEASEGEATGNGNLTYMSYRVKQGDMISVIADTYGVTQDTIISVNNIRASRLIQIGQYLKIPSMPGILYTVRNPNETAASISEKYNVDPQKCALVNNIGIEENLATGKTLFVPDAAMDWITRQEINGDLFIKPIKTRFVTSSRYGWRKNPFNPAKRTFHGGIDMACPKGTRIYAALPGRIASTGYSNVYGNYVIIVHHSGYKTLYAHMSSISTSAGKNVDTTTVIGRVGSTGMSTGPHLHFTVYKNGRSVNPANLWK